MLTAVRNGIKHDNKSTVKRITFAVIFALYMIGGQAYAAEDEDILRLQESAFGLDALQEAAGEYAPEVDWTRSPDFNAGMNELLETGTASINGILKKAVRSGVLLMAVVLMTGLADSVSSLGSARSLPATSIAAVLAITTIAVTDVNTLIGLGREVIGEIEVFSKVLLPTIAAAVAAVGAPGRAAVHQMAVMLFSDILISLINRFLLPLLYTYIAANAAYAAIGNEGLKRIAAALKWVITSMLTAVLLVFVAYLSISGVIAGTTDTLTVKATKFTVSTMVPVVGGILSDAAETVLAGASLLKNSIGIFGMLVVLGMCIVPFLQLGIHYLVYKIAAALSATVADSRAAGLIEGLGGAFGMVLGMAGACALLLLISIILAISLVSV